MVIEEGRGGSARNVGQEESAASRRTPGRRSSISDYHVFLGGFPNAYRLGVAVFRNSEVLNRED
jgi:hypothetical protein